MQAKVETKPAKKEEISQQMMPEIPYDPGAVPGASAPALLLQVDSVAGRRRNGISSIVT
jgi:hypothetical protein